MRVREVFGLVKEQDQVHPHHTNTNLDQEKIPLHVYNMI